MLILAFNFSQPSSECREFCLTFSVLFTFPFRSFTSKWLLKMSLSMTASEMDNLLEEMQRCLDAISDGEKQICLLKSGIISHPSNYQSCIKIKGRPILPPLVCICFCAFHTVLLFTTGLISFTSALNLSLVCMEWYKKEQPLTVNTHSCIWWYFVRWAKVACCKNFPQYQSTSWSKFA